MSEILSNRIATRTAGNANILSVLGDLISSDGIQALRVPLGTPGQFLAVDLTQDSGIGWATPTPGTGLTFSDGLTRSMDNVTNDLVTGTSVAQIDGLSTGNVVLKGTTIGTSQVYLTTTATALPAVAGSVIISAQTSAQFKAKTNTTITAADGSVSGDLVLSNTLSGGSLTLAGTTGNVTLNVVGTGTSDLAVNVERDEADSIGRNFALTTGTGLGGTGFIHIESSGGANGELRLRSDTGQASIEMSGSVAGNHTIAITSNGTGANGVISLTSTANTIINPSGVLDIDATLGVAVDSPANIAITAGGVGAQINLTTTGGGSINLTTSSTGDMNFTASHDEVHVVSRNFNATVNGSGGATINATIGNAVLDAGSTDHTGEIRLQPRGAAPAAGETFRIWNGAGLSQQTVLPPSGGTVVDAEMRTQFNLLLTALFGWGWLTNPSP